MQNRGSAAPSNRRPPKSTGQDFFLLQIPLCGEMRLKIDRREFCCSSGSAVMIAPTARVDMQFGPDCDQLIVKVERSDLEQQLERPLGRALCASRIHACGALLAGH